MSDLEIRRKRARYRSWHRGMKEMDFLLGRFADYFVPAMSDSDLLAFEQLLAMPDSDLYRLYRRQTAPPSDAVANPMLTRFLNFKNIN